ncbi:retrovirus-related pol polyprotein from transposon TNT 1-94 [Tanacetum coccineum]
MHQRVQQTNIPVLPSTGVNDSTEASRSKPRSNTKKNRILPAKKKNKKEVEGLQISLKGCRGHNVYMISIDEIDEVFLYDMNAVQSFAKFTWVKFLRSKDETPEFVTTFLKQIQLVHDKKPDLTFLRVFGALCYPTNDSKNLGKFQAKADIGIFVGYAPSRKGYRIYNQRTRRLIETIHFTFDEMHQSMAPVRMSLGPAPFIMTPGQLKSGLAPTDKELEMLFQPMFDEHLKQSRVNEPVPSATEINAQVVPPGTSLSTIIAQDALSTSDSLSTSDIHLPVQHQEIAEQPIQEVTSRLESQNCPTENRLCPSPST